MGKQKQIVMRVNLENERDKAIYDALISNPLPITRILKDLVYDNMVSPKEKMSLEGMKLINGHYELSNKPTSWEPSPDTEETYDLLEEEVEGIDI